MAIFPPLDWVLIVDPDKRVYDARVENALRLTEEGEQRLTEEGELRFTE